MHQMDLFHTSSEDYLYGEIQKTKKTMTSSFRALFALVTELQTQVLNIQENVMHFNTSEKHVEKSDKIQHVS